MALVLANNIAVIRGSISRPLVGVWTADLVVDETDGQNFGPGTAVTITSENGYSLSGTVDPNRTGDYLDAVHVRVLGGKGGMTKASSARSFVQPGAFVKDVVNGLMSDAGETLSTTTSQAWLTSNLTAWSVLGGDTVRRNLRLLINLTQPSYNWRILADGTLWVGAETWPQAGGTVVDTITFDPKEGAYLLGSESPFLQPGQNLTGVGNINRLVDVIEDGRLRTHVYADFPGEGNRSTSAVIVEISKMGLAGVDFFALYQCTVTAQSADLTTVDVSPLGSRNKSLLGGLQRVPVRTAAGIKVKFGPNATVLLGWDGGNPASPYVCCGASGDLATEIDLTATTMKLNNGSLGCARQTDQVTGQAGPYPLANGQIAGGSATVLVG